MPHTEFTSSLVAMNKGADNKWKSRSGNYFSEHLSCLVHVPFLTPKWPAIFWNEYFLFKTRNFVIYRFH